jgi:hypothetical protein
MEVSGHGSEVWNVEDEAAINLDITSYMHSSNDYSDFERRNVDSLVQNQFVNRKMYQGVTWVSKNGLGFSTGRDHEPSGSGS